MGGGEPEVVNVGVCACASFSADQKMIAFNPFTWGGTWKRYRGGTAPKIWVGDLEQGKFWKMAENERSISIRCGWAIAFTSSPSATSR